jgi:protein phosphatase
MMRDGELCQITEDHSMVAKLLSLGIIQPEEVRTHESRNVIFRSLGASPDLQIDLYRISLLPDDRLLLCSDGLWEMVGDSMIEDVLLEYYEPQIACDRLVKLAIQAGGQDNISVINALLLGDHDNKVKVDNPPGLTGSER